MRKKWKFFLLTAIVSLTAGTIAAIFASGDSEEIWFWEEVLLPGNCVSVCSKGADIMPPVVAPVQKVAEKTIRVESKEFSSPPQSMPPPESNQKTFVQIQYLPWKQAYLNPTENAVNGVALGYYMPQQEINGLSLAMLHLFNKKKSGVSFSLIDVGGFSNGFALFFAGGAVKNEGFLVGVWNVTESNDGMQIGVFNQTEKNALLVYPLKPEIETQKFGVQAGMINYSDAPGIQFGLWNTNPNSLIKHFPLINICL